MVDLQNALKTIQQKLIAINLELQKIITQDIDSIKNTKCNNELELLRDVIHILNTAVAIVETILFLLEKTSNKF